MSDSSRGTDMPTLAPPVEDPPPFLPDEVLEALARDPRPTPRPRVKSVISALRAPSHRHSAAFDRTLFIDAPGIVGSIAPSASIAAPSDSQGARPQRPTSRLTQKTIEPLLSTSSQASTGHERRKTLRGLVPNRLRSSFLQAGPASDPPGAVARDTPTQSDLSDIAKAHQSGWTRVASAQLSGKGQDPAKSTTSLDSGASYVPSDQSGVSAMIGVPIPSLQGHELGRAFADLDVGSSPSPDPPSLGAGFLAPPDELPPNQGDAFRVAVVGPPGVGKSTLIRRAFRRAGVPQDSVVTASFTMAGVQHSIDVLDIDSDLLDRSRHDSIWTIAGLRPEAVMLCYDASDPGALLGLAQSLRDICRVAPELILIVLACKSSALGSDAVDPQGAADLCAAYGAGIVRLDGGKEDPQRKSKECFAWVVRQIMDMRGTSHLFAGLTTPLAEPLAEIPQNLESEAPIATASDSARKRQANGAGSLFSADDLIDKFLFASVAGDDDAFINAFLITFRRFVQPARVLERFTERFDFLATRPESQATLRRYGQLRLCSALSTWVQAYPGDFVETAALARLRAFVQETLPESGPWLRRYTYELAPLLPALSRTVDPDAGWSVSDAPPATALPPSTRRTPSHSVPFSQSELSLASTSDTPSITEQSATSSSADRPDRSASDVNSFGSGDTPDSGGLSRRPSGVPWTLVPISNAVGAMREEDLAVQITRLAWSIAAGSTPRDVVRHVLVKRAARTEAGERISRSIDFVNHLAQWVATMILVQSRPRPRSELVAKFVLVAGELRRLEDFNSLQGVLAGLNNQAVHRLSETFDMATNQLDGDSSVAIKDGAPRLPKKLRSLQLLMAPTRSFAAYRLALSASIGLTSLPYMGVILQDLTVVNETASDLEEGLVNWSKFSRLGESAAVLLDLPRNPPDFPVDRTLERYILDSPVLDEDRLYALSYSYRPRDEGTKGRSRFRDFASALVP